MDEHWRPTSTRPPGLVLPVRVDSSGIGGPTRVQARSRRWRRVAHGWYVDGSARPDVVEQRILEQACRLAPHGAITAWAALRWRGGGFFDGREPDGTSLPIPLVMGAGANLRPSSSAHLIWEKLPPWERELVDGLPCTVPDRALFDEVRRRGTLRTGVVAVDMTLAAGITTVPAFREFVSAHPAWTGVPLVRKVLPLVNGESVSPQESWLRLVWVLDANLPQPLVNRDLVSDHGTFLGRPDLLDPEVGLVAEYDGADHALDDRRRHDLEREERFRDHGLECVTVVRGEFGQPGKVRDRLLAAYQRARTIRRPQRWRLLAR